MRMCPVRGKARSGRAARSGWQRPCRHVALAGLSAMVAAVLVSLAAQPASAQQPTDPQRDCQTVLQCSFTKGGAYRGCISAYSCRTCRFVPARCQVGPGDQRRTCRRLVCSWDG